MKISITILLTVFLVNNSFCQSTLENLGPNVNSKYAELRPTLSADGKVLYFVVEGHPENGKYKVDKTSQDVWVTESDTAGNWGKALKCPEPINNKNNDNAIFWTSVDGNKILIRGAYDNGKYLGRGFSSATKNATGWSSPQAIKIKGYNGMSVDNYDGAIYANDEKTMLFYLSEEKNSFLNDIYVSQLESNNEWSVPQKISDSISLDDYDEIAPFVAADGVTMYFSSDRPGGFGGYDIWMTKRLDDTWKNWSNPVNMGDSVNSDKWEAYFSIDAKAEFGYLATTRNSIGEIDLCRIKLTENQKPKSVVMFLGKLYNVDNHDTIPGVTITYEVESSNSPSIIKVENQEFKTILPYGKTYLIKVFADGFETLIDTIDLSILGPYKELHKDLLVHPVKKEIKNEIENNSDSILNELKSKEELDKKEIKKVAVSSSKVPSGKTDRKGDLIKKKQKGESKEKKKSSRDADSKEKVRSKGKEKKAHSRKNIDEVIGHNADEVEKGEVLTVNKILFDFGKSSLKSSSFKQLNKVVTLLKENSKISIELSAHTDNVGTDKYNLKLSRERAKSSRKYLISKGVSSKRITSKGYGERKPIATNKTAKGRKQNRRVEIKVSRKN